MADKPLEVTLRMVPDMSEGGFLHESWMDWANDAAYYRAHPEEECPPSYLQVPSFEEYVAELAVDRVSELIANASGFGFRLERVQPDGGVS